MAGLPLAAHARVSAPPLAVGVAVLSVGAGYVHLAYMQSHWQVWWAYGAFFLAMAVGQSLFAIAVLLYPRRWVLLAGVGGNLAIVGMYVLSRTEGVPMGPHTGVAEEAGAVDIATTASEIVVVAALLVMLGGATRRWCFNALLVAGASLWLLRLLGPLN